MSEDNQVRFDQLGSAVSSNGNEAGLNIEDNEKHLIQKGPAYQQG